MKVTFYFDPSCPFCWITSRWLLMVSVHRDLEITWQPFSLAIKNNELEPRDDEPKHAAGHRASHRVLRVMMAGEAAGANLIDLYTTSGIKHHVAGFDFDDDHLQEILAENNQPADLAAAADDTSYDQTIRDSMQGALDAAGQDIGVPTIVFTNEKDEKQGFFGPVLQVLPDVPEALELWDGLSKLATSSSFYELKRARPSGKPDVYSTAKC